MLKNNKGVTLVELLIVIVILGIIAAIAIPAVGNIVENAQKDAVIADALQVRSSANLAITSEGLDDGEYYPGGPDPDVEGEFDSVVLDSYIQIDAAFAFKIVDGSVTEVAISTDAYSFVGNPTTAERGDVSAGDEAWDGADNSNPTWITE